MIQDLCFSGYLYILDAVFLKGGMLCIKQRFLSFYFCPELLFRRQIGQILRHKQPFIVMQHGISRDILICSALHFNSSYMRTYISIWPTS